MGLLRKLRIKHPFSRTWVSITVLFLCILSGFFLIINFRLNESVHQNMMRADLLMDASNEASVSYIRLKEQGGVRGGDGRKVLAGLTSASDKIKLLLEGGVCISGCLIEPLREQPIRAEVESVGSDLRKMKTETEGIIKKGGLAGFEFDALFYGLMKKAREAEDKIEHRLIQSENYSKKVFYSILIIWTIVAAVAVAGVWIFEHRHSHAEENLKKSLGEKEILLKEIHHRVKNNMQIMSSLLNLQSRYVDDGRALEFLGDYRSRIRSLALVHEKLYMSGDLANIDFRDYVVSLTDILIRALGKPRNVAIDIDIEKMLVNTDTVIPCGMIINELVSNSLKHAFPDGREGRITIAMKKRDDEFILTVEDNGIGIDSRADVRKFNSLGLGLVFSLAEKQLNGRVELDIADGTSFTASFKEIRYNRRV
jgi:two-component sensor histidine kinase